jgi:hypothetical protein
MRVSFIPSDGVAVVNGVARQIDFSGVDPAVHAVQYDTLLDKGRVELTQLNDDDEPFVVEEKITDFSNYQVYLDRWTAAAPPAPQSPTAEEIAKTARRVELATEATTDTFIDSLRGATPDQIKTFVQNNVTDLASAKVFLAKLAVAVAYALSGGTDK